MTRLNSEGRDELNKSLEIIERFRIMSCVMPLDELLDFRTLIDFFAVLPMWPNHGDPVYLVPGGSRECGVCLHSQLALQGLNPAGPVMRALDFDDQDRPECEAF